MREAFKARTIRRELGVPPETLQNMEEVRPGTGREAGLGHVLDEPTWMCSRRVSGGTPSLRRIPH